MAVAAGQKLGPYEIQARVGEGGMGEVYRARDTRLNRSVAIKILPASMADDPARMHRFEQEARTVAALNHPNILSVYDVGVQDGTPFLVMELLEGETLRERLNRGPLGVRKSVEIGLQIAHGLAAAHERGIVHRDLKPENIFISKDGHTKLLDFGLAKATAIAATSKASGQISDFTMQTVQTMQTEPGMVMGTAPYMAPEQVRGEVVDHRADIFSFGAVLYEMLSGKRAFPGDTAVEIMTAILKIEPTDLDLDQLKVPPSLDRIVRHCLEKNPADRFQSARDLTFALGALSGSDSTSALRAQTVSRRKLPLWSLAAAVLLLLAVAGALGYVATRSPKLERMEFSIPVVAEVGHIAISSDGTMLAYVAIDENSGEGVIYVQEIGSPSAAPLYGTDGATYPFWSPDDNYVGFFAQGKLKKISASGGTAQVLASARQPRGASWGSKGVIIYAPDSGGPLWRVDSDGTDAAPLTDKSYGEKGVSSHRWPVFLPDGNHFLFWGGDFDESPDDKKSGIYWSSISDREHKKLVTLAISTPGYSRNHLFYVGNKGALIAVPIDVSNGTLAGKPQVIAPQVGRHPSTYWGAFTVSLNGTVVMHRGTGASQSQLIWYDRSGKELGKVSDAGLLANPNLSPDGRRVAFDVADMKGKNIDVYINDLQHGGSTRFTFDPAEETTPVWSRDGKEIAYRSASGAVLRLKNSSGFEGDRGITTSIANGVDLMPNSFTPDDRQLLMTSTSNTGGSALYMIDLQSQKITPLLSDRNNKSNGQISPDGKWVAYESDESGQDDVYISPFPSGGGKLQVSRGGGSNPRWRGDGKEIFYLDSQGNLVSVSVDSEGTLSAGTPKTLFQSHARSNVSSSDLFSYDVMPDGQRFLIDRYVKPPETPPLSIILNAVSDRQ
ncbi:MAG TPA: protein kinase [Terriglobales bacterium]